MNAPDGTEGRTVQPEGEPLGLERQRKEDQVSDLRERVRAAVPQPSVLLQVVQDWREIGR